MDQNTENHHVIDPKINIGQISKSLPIKSISIEIGLPDLDLNF